MTLDELEDSEKPTVAPSSVPGRWMLMKRSRALQDREQMAKDGKCFHCKGNPVTMREVTNVTSLPGVRYFVCTIAASHTVLIMPEEV